MNTVKLFIADDSIIFREGLASLIEKEENIEIVGTADGKEDCLKRLEETMPDLLLLDAAMSDRDGWEVLKQLRLEKRTLKILIMMYSEENADRLRAQRLGADGFLSKKVSFSVLRNTIFTLVFNQYFSDPEEKAESAPEKEKLTRREIEVLGLIAEGLFNKEIAFRLSISEKTVKNHITNIFKKIGVSDRTQAAVYAIKNHIVEL